MEIGKALKHSPILNAIREVEAKTTAEIRVHLSKRWTERDPFGRALRLFHEFGMTRTTHHNAVLIYVNLRRRKFSVIADSGLNQCVPSGYWDKTAKELSDHLRSTHPENAIALAVRSIGKTLEHFFPVEPGSENHNELSDEVTTD